jgi:ATP/maltotriose-dependent transcriptional regulator MalT
MLEPFVLPPSKLAPPRIGVALLRRPHLLDVLHRGLARRLVLLTAEAGYGTSGTLIRACSPRGSSWPYDGWHPGLAGAPWRRWRVGRAPG